MAELRSAEKEETAVLRRQLEERHAALEGGLRGLAQPSARVLPSC